MEDDREIRYLLSVTLAGEGREVLLAENGAEGERLLAEHDVDLMVLDLLLPDTDGRTLLQKVRANSSSATLPVIVITSRVGSDIRAECYDLGADSFVEKPFDPDLLASDVSLRLERAAALEREAHKDDLTGLLNHAGLLDELAVGEATPARTLLIAEIDGLREVSDRYGWGTADMIVCKVAAALVAAVPADAVLAHVTVGEFGIVLDAGAGEEAVETVLSAVRSVPVHGPDGETFRLTASVGLAANEGVEGPEGVLEEARRLVRKARHLGGNRAVTAAPESEAATEDALVLVAEDDDITAKILVHRLAKEGFRVERYDNGQDAYRAALTETPALVILDVKMPGMNGFEVLERLRKTPSYANVPIMMLTSMGSEADVVRGFQLGADDYILKPFSPTELVARLKRMMARGHAPGRSD